MKKLENLKRISCLFGLLLFVALFTLACGANNTSNSTKNNSSINSNNSNKTSVKKEKSATKRISPTYLYSNRDPRVHYIKKDYVYYDGLRPYVYIIGPDRVIRRKYIRVGLINRYYTEILDELDDAYETTIFANVDNDDD